MADELEIASKAIKQIQDLRAELVKLSQDVQSVNKNAINITTPGGLNKSNGDNAKAGAEIDALKAKYISLNDAIAKKAEQSRLAEIKLQQAREKAFDDFEKILAAEERANQKSITSANKKAEAEAKQNLVRRQAFDKFEKDQQKEEAALKKAEGAYQRIQNSLNLLTKTYNDLAIRKELGNTLTAKEEKQLTSLSARINTYQTALKNTDAQIGKNQRNVGNYTSGWNALGNSINQLTREAPAFANSLNTGFMAISNNIPALTDAIKGIREQNKLLAAEGKPTESVLKQLAGAIFSWQTLISVGVTLLTVYGGKLVDMALGLGDVEKALKKVEQEQKRYNDRLEDANRNIDTNIQLEKDRLTQLGKNQDEINNLDKKGASEKLKNYETIRNLAKKALDLEISNILTRKHLLDSGFKFEEDISKKLYNEKIRLEKSLGTEIVKFTYLARTEQEKAEVQSLSKINRKIVALETLKNDELYNARVKSYVEAESATRLFGQKVTLINSKVATENITNDKKEKKSKNEKIEALDLEGIAIGTTIQQLDKYIDMLETELVLNAGNEEAYKNISVALEQVKKAKTDLITGGGEIISTANIKEVSTALEDVKTQLSDLQKNYLKSFVDEFASNSGFSETFKILNDEIDGFGENFAVTFNAIAESAQEAFNFISNASQQNFDSERERLQNQYDIALTYAGENKAAQEKLANDLEKQKKDIANRENKAKQKQAIFNIAIDTAQGIISALASTPPNVPLSIFIGALGAAQIALVASQKVPQYWMGGTHDGGLMMVNDGSGSNFRETIVTPDGNIHKPQGKNVLMDAPKGTKIFNHDQWNEQMNNMLKGNGINWNMPVNNNNYSGLSKDDMEEVMLRTLGSQSQHHTIFDANGVVSYIDKKGNITKSSSNRGNSIKTRFT